MRIQPIVLDKRVPQLEPIDLLQAIEPERCYLIVGPRRTGKTTLLQHLVARHEGPVVVFDPKIQPAGKWGRAEVVGANGNYEAIGNRMTQLVTLMHNGGIKEGRMLVLVDELWNLLQANRQAVSDLWRIVTLGAEAGFDVLVGTHSGRVEALGISGQGDLAEAFILVTLGKVRDRYTATIDFGPGPVPAQHPGPFMGWPEAPAAEVQLNEAEQTLVKLAIEHLGGDFSIKRLLAVVKETQPAERWEAGGDLTEYQIGQIAKKLLAQGLLIAEDKTVVPPRPRMVGKNEESRGIKVHARRLGQLGTIRDRTNVSCLNSIPVV